MSGQSRSTSPRSGIPPGRHSPWFALLIGLLVLLSTACSDGWEGDPTAPTISDVTFELGCGTQENPCIIDPIENICATDPSDPMCTEEDENGCIPIEDPNWCQGSGGSGDPGGGSEGGGGDPPDPPPLEGSVSLQCDTVPRGAPGGCTLSGTGDVVISNIQWTAQLPDAPVTTSGVSSWNGTMAWTTAVQVTFDTNLQGAGQSLQGEIMVETRNWDWAGSIDTDEADPGEVDECFHPDWVGVAAGSQCTSYVDVGQIIVPTLSTAGFSVGVGSGPNEGLFFVSDPVAHLSMRSQVARRYRPDADGHSIQGTVDFMTNCGNGPPSTQKNNHEVNAACPEKEFEDFVARAWSHENEHLSVAAAEALKSENDVYTEWESMVFLDQSSLVNAAVGVLNGAGNRILTASEALDHGPMTHSFDIWKHTGSGFGAATMLTH